MSDRDTEWCEGKGLHNSSDSESISVKTVTEQELGQLVFYQGASQHLKPSKLLHPKDKSKSGMSSSNQMSTTK